MIGYCQCGNIQLLWIDYVDYWEFVYDRIDRGGGREFVIGVKAAPDGVAIEIKLIYEERKGGIVLWRKI